RTRDMGEPPMAAGLYSRRSAAPRAGFAVSAFGDDPFRGAPRTGSIGPWGKREGFPSRSPPRLVAGYGRVPWQGHGSISLTAQSTGRSHRLKDCAAPPI